MKQLRPVDLDTAEPISHRGPGKRSSATMRSLAERDRLLREAADCFCVGLSDLAAAMKLAEAITRYRCSCWRRDRTETTCPERHANTIREACFRILKARDVDLSLRHLRRILGRERISAGTYSWPTAPVTVMATTTERR